MEVRIISMELVKPSSPQIIQTKPPHKLCLFDQLTPLTYTPVILFYTNPHSSNLLHHLKRSLSDTLNVYYPISGRSTSDNLFIHSFNEGVPFVHVQVDCLLSDFLKRHHPDSLNLLLPRQPFQKESLENRVSFPVLEIQLSVFSCGGFSLSWACSHKLIDAFTLKSFLNLFSSVSRGRQISRTEVEFTDFGQAAKLFPPRETIPRNFTDLMENVWFTQGSYVTRAIAKLRAMATTSPEGDGTVMKKRSRVEAVSCFIWKCYMAASRSLPGSPKTSVLVQAVNLRDVTDPPLTGGNSIGNVFWWATAMADSESKTTELGELASQLSEAIELYKSEYVKSSMQGEEGFDAMSSYFEQLEGLLFGGEEKPDILAFTSWTGTGIAGQDFGWGSPVRLAVMGKPGDGFRNMTVLVDSTEEKGSMEAWITLEEKIMAVFEWDPDFLAFASYSSSSSSSDKLIVSSL
ncbi:Stemmadenine O-acetyltransferase [Linum perenne]